MGGKAAYQAGGKNERKNNTHTHTEKKKKKKGGGAGEGKRGTKREETEL